MKNHDETVIEMLRNDPDMALNMTAVIKATVASAFTT